MITIPPHIASLQPYVPGKPIETLKREKGLTRIVKLASNENPCGPSPKAMAVLQKHLTESHLYPDASAHTLIHALSEYTQVPPEQIVCGSGIDSLLGTIINAFTDVGDEVLTFQGSFIGLYVNVRKYNRTLRLLPLVDYHLDLTLLLENLSPRTKLIYIANPNNPTGTLCGSREIENFLSRVPPHILVILDEAYHSFASIHPDYPDGLQYLKKNVIVTRTFSKDYGLAGLRIGFAIGPKSLISHLYKFKLPFEPARLSQLCAAAALQDTAYLKASIQTSQESLCRLMSGLQSLGIRTIPPSANFIMMVFDSADKAQRFHDRCLDRGLILRHLKAFGIPEGVRINSGTQDETSFALAVMEEVYESLL